MQYMHFNSSCAFCCVATLLELEGREISDTQLFREMRADLLLHREHETGTWQTGAMLQSGVWFDLALRPMGFSLEEVQSLDAEAVVERKPPFMVGLKREQGGRHAHILMEHRGDKLVFLNPHREGDGEPDLVTLTKEECVERLAPASTVGFLASCTPERIDFQPLFEQSRENWHRYQEELTAFATPLHSCEEFRAAQEPLLRALLLDGLEGARVCGHREQAERLRKLQSQFLSKLRQGKPFCLWDCWDKKDLSAAFAFYQSRLEALIQEGTVG